MKCQIGGSNPFCLLVFVVQNISFRVLFVSSFLYKVDGRVIMTILILLLFSTLIKYALDISIVLSYPFRKLCNIFYHWLEILLGNFSMEIFFIYNVHLKCSVPYFFWNIWAWWKYICCLYLLNIYVMGDFCEKKLPSIWLLVLSIIALTIA